MKHTIIIFILIFLVSPYVEAKNCIKGKPCGNTCINVNYVCHVGTTTTALTCTAPQVLQNNVCVTLVPICTAPQVRQNNVCVTPVPTCTAPQVLQNNVCVTPIPTCTAPTNNISAPTTSIVGASTMVRMQTPLGIIDVRLFDSAVPLTVANFLSYVNSGAFNQSFIHLSMPGFVIQGGGYVWNTASNSPISIFTNPPVANEFSSTRSNLRGTIAMAKLDSDSNSASSQWFFNLADNSANLDVQNGGFTVFGQVVANSMSVVDAIAALPTVNIGGAFTQLPLVTSLSGASLQKSNLIITSISSNSPNNIVANDFDRVFAYLETVYPQYLCPGNSLYPANAVSSTTAGYYYRYYPISNSYIAASDGVLYYLGSASQNQMLSLGALSYWVAAAIAAGY